MVNIWLYIDLWMILAGWDSRCVYKMRQILGAVTSIDVAD